MIFQIHIPFLQINFHDVDTLSTSLLTQVLWWVKYFDQACSNSLGGDLQCHSFWVNQLMLEVSRVSRKEGNLMLAQKLLIDYLNLEDGLLCGGTNNKLLLEDMVQKLTETSVRGKESVLPLSMMWGVRTSKALTEVAKVLYR
jgi:hypothetical protein